MAYKKRKYSKKKGYSRRKKAYSKKKVYRPKSYFSTAPRRRSSRSSGNNNMTKYGLVAGYAHKITHVQDYPAGFQRPRDVSAMTFPFPTQSSTTVALGTIGGQFVAVPNPNPINGLSYFWSNVVGEDGAWINGGSGNNMFSNVAQTTPGVATSTSTNVLTATFSSASNANAAFDIGFNGCTIEVTYEGPPQLAAGYMLIGQVPIKNITSGGWNYSSLQNLSMYPGTQRIPISNMIGKSWFAFAARCSSRADEFLPPVTTGDSPWDDQSLPFIAFYGWDKSAIVGIKCYFCYEMRSAFQGSALLPWATPTNSSATHFDALKDAYNIIQKMPKCYSRPSGQRATYGQN
jgi:hypothetical protein